MQAPGYQLLGDTNPAGCNTGKGEQYIATILISHCKNMCRQNYKSAWYKQEEFP